MLEEARGERAVLFVVVLFVAVHEMSDACGLFVGCVTRGSAGVWMDSSACGEPEWTLGGRAGSVG